MNESDRISRLEAHVDHLQQENQLMMACLLTTNVDRDLFLTLFRKLGLDTVDGIPLDQWWATERESQRETMLLHHEDQNPGAAAWLQSLLDPPADHSGSPTEA